MSCCFMSVMAYLRPYLCLYFLKEERLSCFPSLYGFIYRLNHLIETCAIQNSNHGGQLKPGGAPRSHCQKRNKERKGKHSDNSRDVNWAMPTKSGQGTAGQGPGGAEPGPPGQQVGSTARLGFQMWNPGMAQDPGAPAPG